MGVFSDMIRGIIAEELKAMAAEDAANNGNNSTGKPEDGGAGKPEGNNTGKPEDNGAGKPEGNNTGKPEDNGTGKPEDNNTGKPEDIREMLRTELRSFMAESLNGEPAEGEMPTADEALKNILGFADDEKE